MLSGIGQSAVINLSGRQRMLSQRIAGMAIQARDGDVSAREEMLKAVSQMDEAERTTAEPYRTAGKGTTAHLLHDMYFEGEAPLDVEVHKFLDAARLAAQGGENGGGQALQLVVVEARSRLLDRLNEVVGVHERDAEERLKNLAQMEWLLFGVMMVTLVLEGLYLFRPMVEKVISYSESLIALTNTDQLTGAANRRGFEERSRGEFARSQRYKRPLSLLVLDVDHFKKVNDTFGHPAGDAVLAKLAGCLQGQVRPIDVVGRLGGEEFGVLLPETDLPNAAVLAERLRKAVSELAIVFEDCDDLGELDGL
jgi:diguanylate cyclase (GGDEF)-like protein